MHFDPVCKDQSVQCAVAGVGFPINFPRLLSRHTHQKSFSLVKGSVLVWVAQINTASMSIERRRRESLSEVQEVLSLYAFDIFLV